MLEYVLMRHMHCAESGLSELCDRGWVTEKWKNLDMNFLFAQGRVLRMGEAFHWICLLMQQLTLFTALHTYATVHLVQSSNWYD